MEYDVFISYARQDGEFVFKLTETLAKNGFKVFYDSAQIIAGDILVDSLKQAVENSNFVIVIMSPDYFDSRWTKKELEIALNNEFNTKEVKVLPILYRDCEIPAILKSKIYLDFKNDEFYENGTRKLIEAIGKVSNRKSLFNRILNKSDSKTSQLEIGSIPNEKRDSIELKIIVEELKSKVELFLKNVDEKNLNPENNLLNVDPKLCFIVMPFNSDELNDVYEYFIKPSIENKCDLKCVRGDDVFGSNIIMDDIRKSIEKSRLIIADLTGRNPNVFYEIGIAHTLNKDVLLLSQTMDDVPFDLRHMRVLIYDYTPKGCRKLEFSIVENIKNILSVKD